MEIEVPRMRNTRLCMYVYMYVCTNEDHEIWTLIQRLSLMFSESLNKSQSDMTLDLVHSDNEFKLVMQKYIHIVITVQIVNSCL